jgi:hypothetical protein
MHLKLKYKEVANSNHIENIFRKIEEVSKKIITTMFL